MTSGIYLIVNTINNKFYVGSTMNFEQRKKLHTWELINNRHSNYHLQRAWNNYGGDNFKFFLIEIEIEENLLVKEAYWIKKLNACDKEIGYNICMVSRSQFGVKRSEKTLIKMMNSQTGRKHSEETKIKIGNSKLGKKRKPRSQEWCNKISLLSTGRKLSEESRIERAEKMKRKRVNVEQASN